MTFPFVSVSGLTSHDSATAETPIEPNQKRSNCFLGQLRFSGAALAEQTAQGDGQGSQPEVAALVSGAYGTGSADRRLFKRRKAAGVWHVDSISDTLENEYPL